jgi:transposase
MTYQRIEVLTGIPRRRRYSAAEKMQMVEAAFRPGVVVAQAARHLGVHPSLLHRWRRLMAQDPSAASPGFIPVTVTADPERLDLLHTDVPACVAAPAAPLPAASAGRPAGVLEVALPGGARLRVEGAVDPALAVAVLGALAVPGGAP